MSQLQELKDRYKMLKTELKHYVEIEKWHSVATIAKMLQSVLSKQLEEQERIEQENE